MTRMSSGGANSAILCRFSFRLNIGIDLVPSSYPMNPGSFTDLGPSSYPFNPGSNPPNSPISFLANLFFY